MQVELGAGLLRVCDWGVPFRPNRPTILWLHGAGMDHSVWMLQARAKPFREVNSLAVDLPRHGGSRGAVAATIGESVRVVAALLDALRIERCTVVGHSMGGLIALELAATQPRRVCRLALLGVAARMPVHPDLLRAAAETLPKAAAMIAGWGIGASAALAGTATPSVCLPAAAKALLMSSAPGVLAADLAACNAYLEGESHAAAVTCPALVLFGQQDRMTPAREGRRLSGLIPAASAVQIAAGHMMMLEQPAAVLELLVHFCGNP